MTNAIMAQNLEIVLCIYQEAIIHLGVYSEYITN